MKNFFLGNTHASPPRTLLFLYAVYKILLQYYEKERNCFSYIHLYLRPVPRRPRPSSSPSTLKHTQRKRSLPLQLLLPPLISIPCPPPRLNSRMHLPQTTHPHHNRHPFTFTCLLCLAYRPRHSDRRDLRLPNDTHSLTCRIAHGARRRVPFWRSGRWSEETHTERRCSDDLRYTRASHQRTCKCGQRSVL